MTKTSSNSQNIVKLTCWNLFHGAFVGNNNPYTHAVPILSNSRIFCNQAVLRTGLREMPSVKFEVKGKLTQPTIKLFLLSIILPT